MRSFQKILRTSICLSLLFFTHSGFVKPEPPKSYELLWKEIESLSEQGLPKSALEVLNIVHQKSVAEKNNPQLLKATLYRFSVMQSFEENHLLKAIDYAKKQLPLLQSPAKEILHSILAELYWLYYQQNRHIFLERSNIEKNESDDPSEWDLNTLRDVISDHYVESIKTQSKLENIALALFEPILTTVPKESLLFQPTLFDFLASRALNYYLNNDAALEEVAPSHHLNNLKWWQPAHIFGTMALPQGDHQHLKVLSILQKLLVSNLRQNHIEAVVSNEMKRYDFLKAHFSGTENIDSLYFTTLTLLQTKYQRHDVSTLVAAQRTSFLIENAATPTEFSKSELNLLGTAIEICNDAIRSYPESRGAALCMAHRQSILQKELATTIQRVELPAKPIPALLTYRNITQPAFRLIKTSSETLENIMSVGDQKLWLQAMMKMKALHSWKIDLAFEPDYRSHQIIIDLPALETGLYILLTAENDQFSPDGLVTFTTFQVSELSFISIKRNDSNRFFMLHRESGRPLKAVNIQVMTREYDYEKHTYVVRERLKLISDKHGSFNVNDNGRIPSNQAFYIEATTKTDTLYSDNYFDLYKRKPNFTVQTKTWFFTDRAIYRPGQTVYFKGITLEKEGSEAWKIKENHSAEVKFFDVNNQEIGSIKVKTNAFGSFEGKFIAPLPTLNGIMRIQSDFGGTAISVEEYKRPTFEVSMQAPEKQYKLNDSVVISGQAKAFAGFGLDSVPFTYRVQREAHFPFWPYWRGYPPVLQRKVLIADGKSATKKDGSFSISFFAIPDYNVANEYPPVFNFTVTVYVTDKNGETRETSQSIQVSDQALVMSSNTPQLVAKTKTENLTLSVTNLQQVGVSAQVELKFYKLKSPERLIRASLFSQPDRMLYSKEKTLELFPLDDFSVGEGAENREKTLIYNQTRVVQGTAKLFNKEILSWPEGEYLLEAVTTDQYNRKVTFEHVFTLLDEKSKSTPAKALSWFYMNKDEAEPNDTLVFFIGSSARQNRVLVEILSGEELIQSKWYCVSNRKIAIPFTVLEKHRGGLRFQAMFVRYNRVHQVVYDVAVPFTNKILDIELETKREKLIPGAEETWSLKIKGKNKDKIAAELLAGMYDASLDQFKSHHWVFNVDRIKYSPSFWNADNGFLSYHSTQITYPASSNFNFSAIETPTLNWFGLQHHFHYGNGRMLKGSPQRMVAHSESMQVDMAAVLTSDATVSEMAVPAVSKEKATQTVLRADFRETAFFFPQLITDSNGQVSFSFKLPDALTKWKLMLLAHTKDLKSGINTYNFTAAKNVMIVPHQPRFYREGDTAWIAAKIVNLSNETLIGIAELEVKDAMNENILPYIPINQTKKPVLNLRAGESKAVQWKMVIGNQTSLLSLRFSTSAGQFTDIEEQIVPVLPSRVMVTETMPMHIAGNSTEKFIFKNLKDAGKNEHNLRLNVQFTTNPVWLAVQALPYIYESGYEHADNILNRYYANTLARWVANSMPNVMKVVESWKLKGSNALASNLEKNPEMKALLLSETPWVLDAVDETAQKRNISLLFDINRMRYEQQQALQKLQAMQLPDGSWPWFPGMPGSPYITQHIVIGLGKLQHIGAVSLNERQLKSMITKALQYLDTQITLDYNKLINEKQIKNYQLSPTHLNYFYASSFFKDISKAEQAQPAIQFIFEHIKTDWLKLNNGLQATAAMVLHRNGENGKAKAILASLRERAIESKELGIYWKQEPGFGWFQAPVENHSMIICAFEEIEQNNAFIDKLRMWLLLNKQTNKWKTSRATADAVYVVLLKGTEWVSHSKPLSIKVGGQALALASSEEGTGIVTKDWHNDAITSDLSAIEVTNPNKALAWGAMFRQFFVPIGQVRASQTQLRINRELFIEKTGKQGIVLLPLKKHVVKVGDKIRVRIVLESDRDLEFVHMKDQRASAFEPTDVISAYKFAFGLYYYQSVRDASTDFFFNYLPKGKYVFEYTMTAAQSGDYTNGYASIQSFYAPEFSSHSEGMRVNIAE